MDRNVISKKLPDSRLLRFMTRAQLHTVWRDIIYEIKRADSKQDTLLEQYYVYMLIVYVYLVKMGGNPKTEYVKSYLRGNFLYVGFLDKWLSGNVITHYLTTLRVCNDGDIVLLRNYLEKHKDDPAVFVKEVKFEMLEDHCFDLKRALLGIFQDNKNMAEDLKKYEY